MAARPLALASLEAPTWGMWAWTAYLSAAVLAFAGLELAGVFEGADNTLSEFAWWQLGVYPGQPPLAHPWPWWVSLAAWLAVAGVLTGHIWFGRP